MSEPRVGTNERLRQHVTRVGFDLSLGKTHIAALVALDRSIRLRVSGVEEGASRMWHFFVPGIRGCEDRGLVLHHFQTREMLGTKKNHMGRHYTITPAGKLVIALLKEAGIWQEFEAELPTLEAVS